MVQFHLPLQLKIVMIQENKDLLVKDLSCRIPYRVCVEHISGFRGILHDITVYFTYNEDDTIKDYLCYTNFFKDEPCKIEFFKPYLYPLSSMTDAQREEFYNKFNINIDISKIFNGIDFCGSISFRLISEIIDWLNENHFDYRGLIKRGLAIDCTNLNIY